MTLSGLPFCPNNLSEMGPSNLVVIVMCILCLVTSNHSKLHSNEWNMQNNNEMNQTRNKLHGVHGVIRIDLKIPKIKTRSHRGGPSRLVTSTWWIAHWNGNKMSYTGTQLALGDRLVHFITLTNNCLGSGTTWGCSWGRKPLPGPAFWWCDGAIALGMSSENCRVYPHSHG